MFYRLNVNSITFNDLVGNNAKTLQNNFDSKVDAFVIGGRAMKITL
jgi:hypothetical protein